MKTLYLALLLACFSFGLASAQIIDIGQNTSPAGESITEETKKESGDSKEENKETPKTELEEKKSSGIFSFMNFSFFKKEKPETVSRPTDETTESYLEKTTRLADDGDVDAQLSLGYAYLYGENSIETNYKKAVKYYALAAAQNDIVALNNLGSLYFSGIGVEQDKERAIALFHKASELGNNEASVNLAFIYLSGNGTHKNYAEAMRLFRKAAEAGNPTAQYMMGYAYYRGFYVRQDFKKAFELMRLAADSKYDDAQLVLGAMYLSGEGTTRNYGRAVSNFEMAANQGNIDAMEELGSILAQGKVYAQNIYKAYVIYNVATAYGAVGAAEKRDKLEALLDIKQTLDAQKEAERYVENPSEVTSYIRQTFGANIRSYIDDAMRDIKR